jgi:UDP-glucose 4-epimerase
LLFASRSFGELSANPVKLPIENRTPYSPAMTTLITGGAGYIGSHAVQRLIRDKRRVVALDNLFRGHAAALDRLNAPTYLTFVRGDITDRGLLESVMRQHKVTSVMHFAALAYVGESVDDPLQYYNNNVGGTLSLLQACAAAGVSKLVFSSSCATYGQPAPENIPVPETAPQWPLSPYGRSKWHCEHVIEDFAESMRRAGTPFGYANLRYFNVCGLDRSGVLGEDHTPETHLIPVVIEAALGRRPHVGVFGTDYPTPDGTCIRDYIHVEDLVDAHAVVMDSLKPGDARAYNLGIGKGYSVRQIIDAVRAVTKRDFKVIEQPRRAGDVAALFANPGEIQRELGWNARITDLHEIITSVYRWFQANPRGYRS